MPEAEGGQMPGHVLIDAGVFIGALLKGDPRHVEARPLVERARRGEFAACTTAGILSEVYGALTWEKAEPRHDPGEAAQAVRLLVEPPSAIVVLNENLERITFACTAKRNLECASPACAFSAHSHAVGRLWAKHDFAHRKREHGSRTPKQDHRTRESKGL